MLPLQGSSIFLGCFHPSFHQSIFLLGYKLILGTLVGLFLLLCLPNVIQLLFLAGFFQFFRLYVVYNGEDKEDVIKNLRNKVKDWDKG